MEKTKEKEKKEEKKFRKKVLDLVVLYSREQWTFWHCIDLHNHKICAGEIAPQVTKGKNRKNRKPQKRKVCKVYLCNNTFTVDKKDNCLRSEACKGMFLRLLVRRILHTFFQSHSSLFSNCF